MNSINYISWINGIWNCENGVTIPIKDRGLALSDGIFETIFISKGEPKLLKAHLRRWEKTAALLKMAPPPQESMVLPLIHEAIDRTGLKKYDSALRINWSRGDFYNRNININPETNNLQKHRFWFELTRFKQSFLPITTIISKREMRNANSLLSQCKTFSYGQAIQAREEAIEAKYDDALLLSTNGKICCGTTANLIIKRGQKYLTPKIETGCLPGIMRERGIMLGIIEEEALDQNPRPNDKWMLINSLGCKGIKRVNDNFLETFEHTKEFWYSLL